MQSVWNKAAWSFLGVVLLGVASSACSTTQNAGALVDKSLLARPAPTLVTSSSAPELDALLSTMFGPGTVTSLPLLKTQAQAVLAKHPDAFEAHEALAHIARLELDHEREWTHLMKAAADLRATDTLLYLRGLSDLLRDAGQIDAELTLFEALAQTHPDPAVRSYAIVLALRWARDLQKPTSLAVARTGSITRWRIIGPFDNDHGKGFITPYPPEKNPDDDTPTQGRVVEVSWRDLPGADINGHLPVGQYVWPNTHSIAYLKTYVYAEKAQLAQLRISAPRAVKAWINRVPVIDDKDIKRLGFDNAIANIALVAGYNEILIKSSQEDGAWSTRVRLTAPDGTPLLLPVLTQQKPAAAAETPTLKTQPFARAALGKSLRDQYLRGAWLEQAGRDKDALVAAQAYLAKAPDNIFGEALLARLYSRNDEDGKAIDLAQSVLARPGEKVPAFLLRRHWFFRGKQRFDRAQADLDAIKATAGSNLVAVQRLQASLFDARGWHEDRCRVLAKLVFDHPGHAYFERQRAECLIKLKKRGERRRALQTAHALLPGARNNAKRLMRVYVDDVDYDAARTMSQQLETLYGHETTTLVDLADLHRRMDDTGRAVRLLEKADAMAPGYRRPQAALATIAYIRRDDEAAVKHWREAYRRDPTQSSLLDRIDHVTGAGPNKLRQLAPDDEAIDALVQKAPTLQVPPGTDVAYLLDDEVTRVEPDGSARAIVTLVRLAITDRGRDRLIKTNYPRGRSKLVHAFVVAPDGSRQEASSIRGGTIRFRRVDRGSVSVLQYEVTRPPAGFLPNHFVSSWYFQGVHRFEHQARWVLMLDEATPLHIRRDGPVEHKTETVDGLQVHTFTGRDIGPIVPEPGMPPLADVAAKVAVSTVTGWDEYVRWERALLQDAFRSNPDLEALAKKLTRGQSTARGKFDRLFHYVAEEIRYQQDYENTIAGVRPHACPIVLERGYGDCKDKAVLLILLGKHVGLNIDFAILRTTGAGEVIREIPNQQFNHAIVYVPAQDDIKTGFFMDPTVDGVDLGTLREDDQGATSLVLDPDTGSHQFYEIPYQPSQFEAQRFDIAVDLTQPDKATARIDVTTRGNVGSFIRRNLRDSKTAEKLFEGLSAGIFPGSRLIGGAPPQDPDNIERPVTFTIDADVRSALSTDKRGQTRLRLPAHIFPLGKFARTDARQFDIRTGISRQLDQHITVKLNPGAVTERLPENFSVEHGCFTAKRTTTQDKSTVSIHYSMRVTCGRIKADDYVAFRTAAQKVIEQQRDVIVFQAGKALKL